MENQTILEAYRDWINSFPKKLGLDPRLCKRLKSLAMWIDEHIRERDLLYFLLPLVEKNFPNRVPDPGDIVTHRGNRYLFLFESKKVYLKVIYGEVSKFAEKKDISLYCPFSEIKMLALGVLQLICFSTACSLQIHEAFSSPSFPKNPEVLDRFLEKDWKEYMNPDFPFERKEYFDKLLPMVWRQNL